MHATEINLYVCLLNDLQKTIRGRISYFLATDVIVSLYSEIIGNLLRKILTLFRTKFGDFISSCMLVSMKLKYNVSINSHKRSTGNIEDSLQ